MAKNKTIYVCSACGADSPKWLGKCPACGEWNSYVEEIVSTKSTSGKAEVFGDNSKKIKPTLIQEIKTTEEVRMDMGDSEFNRVLGGGIVSGSMVLIGGEPGIGKSTLILQTILRLKGVRTLYVSGEESARQLKMRAERIGCAESECYIVCDTSLEGIFTHIKNVEPQLLIIDSIQTISTDVLESSAGSVAQVRECAAAILKYAKESNTPVIVIGHIKIGRAHV